MDNPRLPTTDSATGRGLKTAAQTGIGTVLATAIFGLIVAIWQVPGVPEIVIRWLEDNVLLLATTFGASSGIVAFIWNLFRKNVPNY